MATRESSAELIDLVRELCRRAARPADDTELRGALALATARDETALRKLARRDAPARPLGPLAWLDVARGVEPAVAAAREVGGYYALLAERDALAAMLQGRGAEPASEAARPKEKDVPAAELAPAPVESLVPAKRAVPSKANRATGSQPAVEPDPAPRRARARRAAEPDEAEPEEAEPAPEPRGEQQARAQHLLGLFAYHRDAPLVARALGIGMVELERELDRLKLRRKAFRLVRGFDSDLPAATPIAGGRSGPPVRRRPRPGQEGQAKPANPSAPLETALKVIGARRAALASRLGFAKAELPGRLRAAGLERRFEEAERDLIRELYARHRGAQNAVAKDLGASEADLREIIAERALAREVEGLRERYRRQARQDFKWPRDRIEQVLREREWLEDLGVWEELRREVEVRTRLLWKDVRKKPDALALLQKTLRITPADARELRRMLDLR